MHRNLKAGRWVALGTVLGVVAAWGGFGLVGAVTSAPTSITTCTKVSTGKTKVIESSSVAKCTKKGKGISKRWTPGYQTLLRCWNQPSAPDSCSGKDFSGLDLSGIQISQSWATGDFTGANFTGTNFTGAAILGDTWNGADFDGANFTNALMFLGSATGSTAVGAIWNNTTCPDFTNSDANGGTCVGHGFY